MKFSNRDRPTKTAFIISTFSLLFYCCIGALPFTVQPDEMATVVGKSFTYKLPAEMSTHAGCTLKFHTPDSENLPSWLEYDDARHLLLGVPSSHDKGSHTIRLDILIDFTNKTADTINFLTIEVVEYEEDLNHFKIISSNTLSQPSKNTSQSHLACASLAPVIVATLVFDLNSRKLSGSNRVELLNSVSEWTATGVDQLRWMPGKGEKTAFNLKDVVVLTAGPGWVKDPQERGVSVSWKIGCGNSITESEKSYVSVGQLKSASQTGAFKNELRSPVVAWHVTYGRVKHRQVVRVRRQALAQTPVPTSAFVTPTSAIVTQVIATPAITYTRSPSVFTVTPTASRIIPSPTQTTDPYGPPVTSIVPVPIPNTPPYISKPIKNLTAIIDVPFKFSIPPETFHDNEDGQTPNLKLNAYDPTGNALPPDFWLKFDEPSQSLSGTPKAFGDTKIGLLVADSKGLLSPFLVVTIRVVPETVPPVVENTPPYLNEPINNLTAVIDVPFKFYIPPDTFHDKEDGQTPKLTLDVYDPKGNELPSDFWLKLDQASQSLSGTPKALGDTRIGLIVTDSKGLFSGLHVVTIRVVPENVPPVLVNHIDLIPLYIGQPLVFKVPVDTFYDKEDGPTPQLRLSMETLEYKTLNSYSWITFDVRSQTIYALPYGDIIGKHEFLMIAYDSTGMKAIDAFEFHINPAPVKPNHVFGLKLDADYDTFVESVTTRVKLCVEVGNYFGNRFNTSYNDIRVKNYKKGSVRLEWSFANIATNVTGVEEYKRKYVLHGTENTPFPKFKEDFVCPISAQCSVTKTWVEITEPVTTTPGPNVIGRADDDDDGTWWEYTIIPAFVIAALIFIIGLIIIICIRCRRKSRLDKNEKVVFVQRKKPAVFREEYPMREVYGNQPLITPNEKAPLPPPAYPRSSTPTEDPSERLLSDSSPSYQPPFDSGHESAGNSRPPVASYRLPPPYVAP